MRNIYTIKNDSYEEALWITVREGIRKTAITECEKFCCVIEEILNGNRVNIHNHYNEQISAVLQGTCYYYVGDEKIEMKKGSWIVIPPNTNHYIHVFDSAEPVIVLEIYVLEN